MEEGQFQNQGPNEFHDEKKPIKISFSGQEAYEVVKTGASRPFRIHVIIGVVISLICLACNLIFLKKNIKQKRKFLFLIFF